MGIRIQTVELSGEDAKNALPLIIGVVAGEQSLDAAPQFSNASFIDTPIPPALEPTPAADTVESEVEPGALALRLPMPTARAQTARAVVVADDESLKDWALARWCNWNRWCKDYPFSFSIASGSVLGLGILAAQLHWRFDQQALSKWQQWIQPVETVEEAVIDSVPAGDSVPTAPSDASDKAGQPDRLPLAGGSVK